MLASQVVSSPGCTFLASAVMAWRHPPLSFAFSRAASRTSLRPPDNLPVLTVTLLLLLIWIASSSILTQGSSLRLSALQPREAAYDELPDTMRGLPGYVQAKTENWRTSQHSR
ncbi:hypothetical protein NX059_001313 [Plenodomus lindquistii]|nr:hypothetical protein NX059_001313 [Plenodomus lindquistii]